MIVEIPLKRVLIVLETFMNFFKYFVHNKNCIASKKAEKKIKINILILPSKGTKKSSSSSSSFVNNLIYIKYFFFFQFYFFY